MSLQTNLTNAFTRVATELKSHRTLMNGNAADLSALTTTQKASLLAAVNELHAMVQAVAQDAGAIDDATATPANTWSAAKVAAEIQAAKDQLTSGAGAALDTLAELAAALGNDANFASSMSTALGKRVRFDAPQVLGPSERLQACENIGVGDPETDFVASFTTALA